VDYRESERARPTEPGVVLYPALDESASRNFKDHEIAWWGGADGPVESPISSQVACVNHLEPARVDADVALAVARAVLPDASAVAEVEDSGFVGFEWIGAENYLHERGEKRGANRTSIDALMVAELADAPTLVLIEWKYTESYTPGRSRARSSRGTARKGPGVVWACSFSQEASPAAPSCRGRGAPVFPLAGAVLEKPRFGCAPRLHGGSSPPSPAAKEGRARLSLWLRWVLAPAPWSRISLRRSGGGAQSRTERLRPC
jgi:hypothetical protein